MNKSLLVHVQLEWKEGSYIILFPCLQGLTKLHMARFQVRVSITIAIFIHWNRHKKYQWWEQDSKCQDQDHDQDIEAQDQDQDSEPTDQGMSK